MKLLKALVPAVILKKLYGKKYKNPGKTKPLSDEQKDALQDRKDDSA
jgi:hypothetical protein